MVLWSGEAASIGLGQWGPKSEPAPNACRYAGGGHVESYFLRANDPLRPRAIWIRATILAPRAGPPLAESWLTWFDGERGSTYLHKLTQPLSEASFSDGSDGRMSIRVGGFELELGSPGSARGTVCGHGDTDAHFDLAFARPAIAAADPLCIYPWHFLREGPFPKSKLITPFPWLTCSGRVAFDEETIEVDDWSAMQGHNWGREHAHTYAWGHCVFPRRADAPEAVLEAFSGRAMVVGRLTPVMSALVVRRGERTYRFDRIFDFWRQSAEIDGQHWSLALTGADGEARLEMDARGRPQVCLDYLNPDGRVSSCSNSKLARVRLQLQPREGPAFELVSEHGGALEVLEPKIDHGAGRAGGDA